MVYIYSMDSKEFELVTAVMAGTKTLELRVLSTTQPTDDQESCLTRRLCRLMDSYASDWRR